MNLGCHFICKQMQNTLYQIFADFFFARVCVCVCAPSMLTIPIIIICCWHTFYSFVIITSFCSWSIQKSSFDRMCVSGRIAKMDFSIELIVVDGKRIISRIVLLSQFCFLPRMNIYFEQTVNFLTRCGISAKNGRISISSEISMPELPMCLATIECAKWTEHELPILSMFLHSDPTGMAMLVISLQ